MHVSKKINPIRSLNPDVKQRELEMILQELEGVDMPDPKLEQYATPAKVAADLLYLASGNGDIIDKDVIDLGCGNGIFTIGACLLGAKRCLGVDLDPSAIEVAKRNSVKVGSEVDFQCLNVKDVDERFDTCIQNPPFGAQNRHADVPFLHKAVSIADTVYTIHNSKTADFILNEVERLGGTVSLTKEYEFEIPHTFDFHRKERVFFNVTLFRIENKERKT
jgi:putative methylase